MLQIQHICKEYRTGTLVQKALDDVSLNFRDNEFVAILGPSEMCIRDRTIIGHWNLSYVVRV